MTEFMNTENTRRQQSIDFHRNYCVHYAPRECDSGCRAGVDRGTLPEALTPSADGKRMVPWGPCIGGHTLENPLAVCPKWERRSLEQAEEYADGMEACMTRLTVVDPVITAWRRKLPIGKAEVIECPACKGRLHLSQAACNGHVRARCETADCVNFVE